MFLLLSSKTSLDYLFYLLSDTWIVRNYHVQEKQKEVILHTAMKFLASGHWGYVVFRLKQRLDDFMEENLHRITVHAWIMFGLGSLWDTKCWRLDRDCSEQELLHGCPRLIFLPWHLQCHRVTNKLSIHLAHQVTTFPRLHPQTSLLWGSRQGSREQKKVTNTISEMNLEKWWNVSWTWTGMQLEQWHLSVHPFSPVWCTISSWDSSWGISGISPRRQITIFLRILC